MHTILTESTRAIGTGNARNLPYAGALTRSTSTKVLFLVGMWRAFEFDLAGFGRRITDPLEFILTSVEKRPALDAVFLSR